MTDPDVVVVGGGSAGAVVGARLSASGRRSVVVLEAGPDWRAEDAPAAIRQPELIDELTFDLARHARWQSSGIASRRTSAQEYRPYRQGAGFGGSSLINGVVALRPPLADLDGWASSGCIGWSSQALLPALRRLEDDPEFGSDPHHGVGGPTPIWREARSRWSSLDESFCIAAMSAGHPWCPDQNAPEPVGVGAYPGNLRGGERVTSYDGYLEPARDRTNLTLVGDALVERVLLDVGLRAVGVRYHRHGVVTDLKCGEVVLCAGAVGSAAILLRSGVGPADELRELGIDVVVDSPVGQGLQDHPMLAVGYRDRMAGTVSGRGYEVMLRASTGAVGSSPGDFAVHPVRNGPGGSVSAALFVFLHRCESRGVLRLRSPHPGQQPVLDQRMLADPRDRERMRAAVRHTIELAHHRALRPPGQEVVVGRAARPPADLDDDRVLDAMLLAEVTDAKHVTASCPMGRPGGAGVVVDPGARVVGIIGLRVADCSIVPQLPRANTYLTALAIGERVAELIEGPEDRP